MGQEIVLALYRPQPEQEPRLRALVARHVPLLRRLGLLSEGPAILMRTKAGTYLEVLRWRSSEAAGQASAHPQVRELWEEISRISDSPVIDADPESSNGAPRFVSVTLEPRSSEAEMEVRPKLGALAYGVGALSLVPLAGAPLAAVAVFWGLLTKKRGGNMLIWLGFGGLAVSLLTLIAIFAFKSLGFPFGPAGEMLSRSNLGSAVRAVEFHKVQTGQYPESLQELWDTLPRQEMPFLVDMSGGHFKPRQFYYERVDADRYYLLGVGADERPFTADDLLPEIDIKPGSRVGLIIKR